MRDAFTFIIGTSSYVGNYENQPSMDNSFIYFMHTSGRLENELMYLY
jgi:hypothetical protein